MDKDVDDKMVVQQLCVAKCLVEGMKGKQIAELLKVSESTVSKLSVDNPHFKPIKFSPQLAADRKLELLAMMDVKLGKSDVRAKLSQLSPHADGVSVDLCRSEDIPSHGERGFGKSVGTVLSKLLSRSKTVGITWGIEILPPLEFQYAFEQRSFTKKDEPIWFIPLCGVTGTSEQSLLSSSTTIAQRYNRLVNNDDYPIDQKKHVLNMNCIPLAHPSLTGAGATASGYPESSAIEKYYQAVFPQYEAIFGEIRADDLQQGYAYEVDMIITSLGDPSMDTMEFLYPNQEGYVPIQHANDKTESISTLKIKKEISVGEIAGILLPNTNHFRKDFHVDYCRKLNARLATLRPSHLYSCAERASNSTKNVRPPGTTVIAKGAKKSNAIIKAVEEGYINRILIDSELHDQLNTDLEYLWKLLSLR